MTQVTTKYGIVCVRPELHGQVISDGTVLPYVPPIWPVYAWFGIVAVLAYFNPMILIFALPSFVVTFAIGLIVSRLT